MGRVGSERLATDAFEYLLPVALKSPGEFGLLQLAEITHAPFEVFQRHRHGLPVPLNLAVKFRLARHRTTPYSLSLPHSIRRATPNHLLDVARPHFQIRRSHTSCSITI
jgi:hypothetical protein